MSSESGPLASEGRIERLELEVQQLQRRCRRLLYALTAVAALALCTPAVLLVVTSFGSELAIAQLKVDSLTAERIMLPGSGQITAGDKHTRMASLNGIGLAFYNENKEVVRLNGESDPSLAINHPGNYRYRLQLGLFDKSPARKLGLELVGATGTTQASLNLDLADFGQPHLTLYDPIEQRKGVDVSVSAISSKISLSSPKKEKKRAELSSSPKLSYFDENDRPLPVP